MTLAVSEKIQAENFPVALRVLRRTIRKELTAVYGFARTVDDLGDEACGDRAVALNAIEVDLRRAYTGMAEQPCCQALQPVIQAHDIPPEPFLRLIAANRQDQSRSRYASFADLLGYCELSANPVGQLVLYIFNAMSPERMEWSDHACTALQIVEHLQDVREDFDRGRVYLPQEDLQRFGCDEDELRAARASRRLRRLIAFETERAADLLHLAGPLVGDLTGQARFAVAGYLAGGRATIRALQHAEYDVLGTTVRPDRRSTAAEMLRLLGKPGRARRGRAS
jgi:squalene synthase HpnC